MRCTIDPPEFKPTTVHILLESREDAECLHALFNDNTYTASWQRDMKIYLERFKVGIADQIRGL